MSYLGPDHEEIYPVDRSYTVPVQALEQLHRVLAVIEQAWKGFSTDYLVEIVPLPTPPTEEEWQRVIDEEAV